MKIRLSVIFSFSLFILIACNSGISGRQDNHNESVLDKLLPEDNKDLKLVSLSDMDLESCSGYGELTNFVSSDFNGDKKTDYAVLLTQRISDEVIEWDGKKLREADILLMVFMDNGKGGYENYSLEKVTGHLPSIFTIKEQPVGQVTERESSKIITLQQPAIARVHCEKSEVVYYWHDNTFKSIVKAD